MRDPFDTVLGFARGAPNTGTFAADRPGPSVRRQAADLTALARTGELAEPLRALAAHAAALLNPTPLLDHLLMAVLGTLVDRAHQQFAGSGRAFLAQAGVRGELADELILARTGTLHVWPGGARMAGLPAGKTSCGQVISAEWTRVSRGAWRTATHRNCRRCERSGAQNSSDRAEGADYPLWRHTIATYDPYDMERFSNAVSDASRADVIAAVRAAPAGTLPDCDAPVREHWQRQLVDFAAHFASVLEYASTVTVRVLGDLAEPTMMQLRTSRPHELMDLAGWQELYGAHWQLSRLESATDDDADQRQRLSRALAAMLSERAA